MLISVGVPAYNEERTIASTLEALANQDLRRSECFGGGQDELKVVVCANGCNDNTAKVASDFSRAVKTNAEKKYRKSIDIEVIETDQKGKPNAWNMIRESCDTEYLFFVDGDVVMDRFAIKSMLEKLNEGYVAVGARSVPSRKNGKVASFLARTPFPQLNLVGMMYGVNNCKLNDCLKEEGFTKMPHNIILDDLFLTFLIGRDRYVIDRRARVHYHPYNLPDFWKIMARNVSAYFQLKETYPGLIKPGQFITFGEKIDYVVDNFRERGFDEGTQNLSSYFVRRLIGLASYSLMEKNGTQSLSEWEPAKSSKMRF